MTIRRTKPVSHWVMLAMATAVLVPCLLGFGTKFIEFIALYRGDAEGAFAISPILNYLLASFGFLLLFGWAALGGMFHDIEAPKYTMLQNEALLDEEARSQRIVPIEFSPAPVSSRNLQCGPTRQPRF